MKTKKLTFSAMMIALSVVIMLSAYFPYLTYAIPCMAALPIMVILIELGGKWAFVSYIASVLPVLLFCEPEAKVIYIILTGYYPVLKAVIERLNNLALEIIVKFLYFNGVLALALTFAVCIFKIPAEEIFEGGGGATFVLVLWILAVVTFFAFDLCITKMCGFYILKFQNKVNKFLR